MKLLDLPIEVLSYILEFLVPICKKKLTFNSEYFDIKHIRERLAVYGKEQETISVDVNEYYLTYIENISRVNRLLLWIVSKLLAQYSQELYHRFIYQEFSSEHIDTIDTIRTNVILNIIDEIPIGGEYEYRQIFDKIFREKKIELLDLFVGRIDKNVLQQIYKKFMFYGHMKRAFIINKKFKLKNTPKLKEVVKYIFDRVIIPVTNSFCERCCCCCIMCIFMNSIE